MPREIGMCGRFVQKGFSMFEKFKTLEFRTNFFVCVFVASIITSNMIGNKIAQLDISGIPLIFSVGIIPFFMTFFILDAINEVHGQQKARETVWLAMFVQVFIFLVILASVALPFAARSWLSPEQFNSVFGASLRIIIASLAAFLLADLSDTYIFSSLREKTKGKMLWLRSNVSNFVSEGVDTVVFMFLAFYDLPWDAAKGHDLGFIIALILPYYALKVVLSVINTPFVYAAVRWLKGQKSAIPVKS